mgnify:CR=1 FL=1
MPEDDRPDHDRSDQDRSDADTQEDLSDRQSDEALGAGGAISGQGRSGVRLARKIGTRDELKRANERPAGATRVRKSDEPED